MIPAANTITVAPVGRIAPAAATEAVGDARQQEFQRSLAGQVGKSMQAAVLSRLPDGSYLVRVAGTPARMMLPSNPQPGTELPLTLVSVNPRPTFQLTGAPQSAAFAAFAELGDTPAAAGALANPTTAKAGVMQRAASLFGDAPAAGQLPEGEADNSSTRSTLSAAARVITGVLGAASRAGSPQTAIIAPLPLLSAASGDPARLAAALKDAIGASGLFYESHVAEWSAGQRPLAELQREPQMQRAALANPESAAAEAATAQFINLQLASHEQGRVAWQGQVWPGQDLAWQISRDAPDAHERPAAGAQAQDPPWRSTLRLRFAALGAIGATVVLAGDQLHIELQAGSSEAGSVLSARAGELRRALEASGNPPATLIVSSAVNANAPGHD